MVCTRSAAPVSRQPLRGGNAAAGSGGSDRHRHPSTGTGQLPSGELAADQEHPQDQQGQGEQRPEQQSGQLPVAGSTPATAAGPACVTAAPATNMPARALCPPEAVLLREPLLLGPAVRPDPPCVSPWVPPCSAGPRRLTRFRACLLRAGARHSGPVLVLPSPITVNWLSEVSTGSVTAGLVWLPGSVAVLAIVVSLPEAAGVLPPVWWCRRCCRRR